ncbi:MAG: helix-turn-helix transcriptional regulator [Lachnospiraceae bacterium]|nr:helix-turn-helix transcriptional regulator [Lachnospiraceae bacterium]
MDKKMTAVSASLLVLQLISEKEQYGYQIIKELELRSNYIFSLKEGTLYPILHSLEEKGAIESFERLAETGKMRKYYRITKKGGKLLKDKKTEWNMYQQAVNQVIGEV